MKKDHSLSSSTIFLRKIPDDTIHRIGISFTYTEKLSRKVNSIGAKWSRVHKCWLLPYSAAYYQTILRAFSDSQIIILQPGQENDRAPGNKGHGSRISSNNLAELQRYKEAIVLRGYSPSTLKTYRNEFGVFLRHLKNVHVQDLTSARLASYFLYCHEQLRLSENTIHSRLNAVKFYYETVLNREKFIWEVPRPKRRLLLPRVISEEKIIAGIAQVRNKKHKALIAIAYSAGLRVSEVINLKISDIDSDRMQVFIARAKGKKDRVVTLSNYALQILRAYYMEYKPRVWLFEGQVKGEQYSARSAQEVFKSIYGICGLPAHLTFHSLRHSFATHLLENGTDVKYIQEIMGHNDINTTMRYTHVSKKAIEKIESPLDKIVRKLGL